MKMKTGTMVVAAMVAVGASRMATAGQPKAAADVYADKCAVCHGTDGAGKTAKGRKLKVKDVRETLPKMNAVQMAEVVVKGKDPDMDGFGKEFIADMVKQIVDYYRGLAAAS